MTAFCRARLTDLLYDWYAMNAAADAAPAMRYKDTREEGA